MRCRLGNTAAKFGVMNISKWLRKRRTSVKALLGPRNRTSRWRILVTVVNCVRWCKPLTPLGLDHILIIV